MPAESTMTPDEPLLPSRPDTLPIEGRLLAHRRLLAELMRLVPENRRKELRDWLEERAVYQDGQEDPGAVPDAGIALELARADEFRLLGALLDGLDPE
jgi:hypothetical protein